MELRRLRKNDLRVGAPIAWPLFDEAAQMVVLPGFVPRSEAQREMLADFGLYRSDAMPADRELLREAARGCATPAAEPERMPTFAEVAFPVGTPFALGLAGEPQRRRHAVKLMGWSEGESVLVTHPRTEDHLLAIREGDAFQARAAHDKWTCTFDTTVLRVQLQPFPYLHLSNPSRARVTQVRSNTRVKMGIVASVGARGSSVRHACTLRDLSLSGMLIQGRQQVVKPGEPVDVYFRLQFEGERHVFDLTGHARNVAPATDDAAPGAWNHGIELDPIPEPQRRTLQLYLYARMLGAR
jgi:c-di-GMP-binding flagellar brake protein YcgR